MILELVGLEVGNFQSPPDARNTVTVKTKHDDELSYKHTHLHLRQVAALLHDFSVISLMLNT